MEPLAPKPRGQLAVTAGKRPGGHLRPNAGPRRDRGDDLDDAGHGRVAVKRGSRPAELLERVNRAQADGAHGARPDSASLSGASSRRSWTYSASPPPKKPRVITSGAPAYPCAASTRIPGRVASASGSDTAGSWSIAWLSRRVTAAAVSSSGCGPRSAVTVTASWKRGGGGCARPRTGKRSSRAAMVRLWRARMRARRDMQPVHLIAAASREPGRRLRAGVVRSVPVHLLRRIGAGARPARVQMSLIRRYQDR